MWTIEDFFFEFFGRCVLVDAQNQTKGQIFHSQLSRVMKYVIKLESMSIFEDLIGIRHKQEWMKAYTYILRYYFGI